MRRLQPDFKTIADFRRDNRSAFRQVFREFVSLCRELDLYGRELVAVDGTRIKAVNNRDRNFTHNKLRRELQKADERLDRYLKQMDEADTEDSGDRLARVEELDRKIAALRERRASLEAHRETLHKSGDEQLSLTDPDSRSMHAGTGVGVGYNIQIAVDAKHSLIAEQQVHSKVSDLGLLAETAVAARANLGVANVEAVADKGYYKIGDIEACEAGGVTAYVPKPDRNPTHHSRGHFKKSAFHYNADTDTYVCPGGHRLKPLYVNNSDAGKSFQYVNRAACRGCPLRQRCTDNTHRRISRYENEAVMDRMASRLAARPEMPDHRRECVEHPFGSIKHWMGQDAFLMRRLVSLRRRTVRHAGLTMAAGVLALAGPAPVGAQDAPVLVEYLAVTAQSYRVLPETQAHALDDISRDPGVLNLRIGYATPEPVVRAGALSIELPGTDEILTIDDLVVEDLDSGYALYSGDRLSETSTTLVVMGADVIGTIHHDGELYGVQPLGDGLTAVYRYDAARLRGPPETVPDFVIPDAEMKESALPPLRAPPVAQDSRDQIDVLVVYSATARRVAGNIDARIALLMVDTHRAYANSGITTRLRVVHSYETPSTVVSEINSSNKEQDLQRLRIRGDGFFDDVFAEREQYGADVVILLFVNQLANVCGGGIAFLLDHGPGDAELAFGLSGIGRTVACRQHDGDTFAHEIGHIQGASHNPEEPGALDRAPYSYGHGFCNAARNWRTVMAYNTGNRCRPRLPHFSNPTVLYQGTATGDATRRNAARVINETAIHVANFRQSKSTGSGRVAHLLPYFLARRTPGRQGFVRIVNRSDRSGTVMVTAIDDEGRSAGTETLDLDAGGALHFNSDDLERGNRDKGLSGVGSGTRHWRLLVASELDIQPLAFVRTGDGFVTRMDEVEEKLEGSGYRYIVHFTNPGRNQNQRSHLRLINPGSAAADVTIRAHDDRGNQRGPVSLSLPAGHARHVTASDLESGRGLSGRLGTGAGKWRLAVSSTQPVHVMSLLDTPTGHLTNLSGVSGVTGTTPRQSTDDHGDTPATATVVQAPSSTRGSLESGGDKDYFRFDLPQGGRLQVHTTGSTNTYGTLLRGGSVIASNDDGGSGDNFRITVPQAQAGTWYVEVRGFGSSTTGHYALQVEFSGAPSGADVELSVIDRCNDGEDIQYRYFEFTSSSSTRPVGVWPGGGLVYFTRGLSVTNTNRLRCNTGRLVCYGGESRDTQRYYWGVGIDGDEGCSRCCVTCRPGRSAEWNLLCGSSDSTPLSPGGPAGEAPESVPLRR